MSPPWPHDGSFLLGANLPWISYGNDFGANAWHPGGGLARPEASRRARELLAPLADAGARLVRWFVLCDGRGGLRFDEAGRLAGLDDRFFTDFDTATELVRSANLTAVFVLFDFLWFRRARLVNGVQLGGRRRLLEDVDERRRLLDTVVRPILDRYRAHPAIAAWEIVNEPEWAIAWSPLARAVSAVSRVHPHGSAVSGRVSRDTMRAIIAEVAALVHERTQHMVTAGSGRFSSLSLVTGLGLDFYQVHWYDRLRVRFDLSAPIAALGLGQPVLLGEFPSRGSARSPADIVQASRAGGFAGALAWSMTAGDRVSDGDAVIDWLRESGRSRTPCVEPPFGRC